MKKILFLIHDLGPGGAEKVLVNLVNNMDSKQYEITVMTLFDVGINKRFLSENIHYKTVFKKVFPGNSHIMKLFSPELLHKMFIKEKYDIEVAYLEGPSARIISGCNYPDTKKVCWIHIEQKNRKGLSASFRGFKEAVRCYTSFDKIICVSKTVMESFVQQLPMLNSVEVIYNTNESEKIRQLSTEQVSECTFREEEIKLVGVGKLLKSKGFDRILRIVRKLHEEYPVHLYILGEGPEEDNLKQYIENHQMEDYVQLLGYQINPYKFVARSDLFICASYAEGFSTASTEALIVGTPICTVDVSGMREMLGDHCEYGLITDNTNKALYKGIRSLLDKPYLLKEYKRKACARGEFFRTEKTVSDVEKMFSSI